MFDLLVIGGLGVDLRVRVPAIPPPAADSLIVPPMALRIGNTGAGVALPPRRPRRWWTPTAPGTPSPAGLVAGRLRGAALPEAAAHAAVVAAAACTHDGMEYPPGLLPRA